MTLQDYLENKTELLRNQAIPDAENEVWVILLTCTKRARSEFRFSMSKELASVLSAEELGELEKVFERRAKNEPLAYIVGHAPFYDMEFSVGEGVLIPRFDTEILVETALATLGFEDALLGSAVSVPKLTCWSKDSGRSVVIYDLCTGSGVVGITLASELRKRGVACKVVMTEISEDAARYARANVERVLGGAPEGSRARSEVSGAERAAARGAGAAMGMDVSVEVVDLWPKAEAGTARRAGAAGPEKADLIVANPPYIAMDEMAELAPEVREHEPDLALTDGGDGLSVYRRIFAEVGEHLKKGGALCLEHGYTQKKALGTLGASAFEKVVCVKDYGQQDRVTCGIYRGEE